MRKRKYLIGAVLASVGALVVSGTASAAVTNQTLVTTVSPTKFDKKTFGPVNAFTNVVDTTYTGGFTPNATQTVLTFSKDIKFTPGNLPQCNLSTILTVPESTAEASCGASRVGQGDATINGGALTGKVAAYNGQPVNGHPTIGLHTDLFTPSGAYSGLSTTLTGELDTSTNTLTVKIPPTGTSITHFATTINKIKTGKKKVKVNGKKKTQPIYYVMARCKTKSWVNSETTTFSDGSSKTATSTQACQQKKTKKKK